MGKLKVKGEAGAARNYVTRTQAVKKLQISLADFRRLCILKGIYPREPRHRKKANQGSTAASTFYYAKDIQFLLHEPILDILREQKTHMRRLAKAITLRDFTKAQTLNARKPSYSLEHIIRERYPTFDRALMDLDDALSTIFLFAKLPVTYEIVPAATIQFCLRLCHEFQHYVMHTKSLSKCFLSIKGIYYQAMIHQVPITWITPYAYTQEIPGDVDFRIMATFLEFYLSLLQFVLYKLYSMEGLVYPPKKIDMHQEDGNGELGRFILESYGTNLPSVKKPDNSKQSRQRLTVVNEALSEIQHSSEMDITDMKLSYSGNIQQDEGELERQDDSDEVIAEKRLFLNMHFFISREVPAAPLYLALNSFSAASVSYPLTIAAGSPMKEIDIKITHQIVDRPCLSNYIPGRVYVQPQWVFDSINQGKLCDTLHYAPGVVLPPHFSPFEPKDFDSSIYEKRIDQQKNEVSKEVHEYTNENPAGAHEFDRTLQQNQIEVDTFHQITTNHKFQQSNAIVSTSTLQESDEVKGLAKIMMTNKQQKLFAKMLHGNKKRLEEKKTLERKRKLLKKRKTSNDTV